MNREEIVLRLEELGLVPVVRAPSAGLAIRAARALREGGIDVLEITMTVPNALEVMRELTRTLGDRAIIGAGTVLDEFSARACIEAGAEFVVSPGLDLETVRAAHALGKPVIPGALTPTEVICAWRAGADMVKVFPCSAMGGAKYIRSLRAPLPGIKLMPTGGVSLATIKEFVQAGAVALGVGSELVDKSALETGDEQVLIERARKYLAEIRAARAECRAIAQ